MRKQPLFSCQTITPALFAGVFAMRDPQGHKGTFGSVAILGGAAGMTGAALLAGRSALKSGAGRVYVCLTQDQPELSIDIGQPELMLRSVDETLAMASQIGAWGAGCGLGQQDNAIDWLRTLFRVRQGKPMVLDADALNALARGDAAPIWGSGKVVLTPHPTEAARLLNTSTDRIQTDRIENARRLAAQYQAWVVLKGHGTVVANPEGECFINPTGCVALATAGTGDVLTGLIASLLAQGHDIRTAVCGAVWLHGAAGQWMTTQLGGPVGVTATEVIDAIRHLRNNRERVQQLHNATLSTHPDVP